jgi:flagellar protein FlaI
MAGDEAAFKKAMDRYPHLREYVKNWEKEGNPRPEYYPSINRDMESIEMPNFIYPVGPPIFIHILKRMGEMSRYLAIEPQLTEEEKQLYDDIFDSLVLLAPTQEEPTSPEEFKEMLNKLMDLIIVVGTEEKTLLSKLVKLSPLKKVYLTEVQNENIRYHLIKDLTSLGILEPMIRDTWIEDISCTGLGDIFLIHKIFKTMRSNIAMASDMELDEYAYKITERMGRPVSDAKPIADGALSDGSRVNVIYSRDISRKGTSFTIRKFAAEPLAITQIIKWGCFSSQMAAYVWICLENGMSLFVCGETASGKTTSLNAINCFIPAHFKMFTVEDTPEVLCPHSAWQQLVTRQASAKGTSDTDVDMFDLLKAALRSRPNYIIAGEIRGEEGFVAFQGMQTGHPCMATFHAGSVRAMLQRLTGKPINIPLPSVDNLNVVLIQQAVRRKGKTLRRVLEIGEIEGYSKEAGGVLTRTMFEWEPTSDTHVFKGLYNSYILEEKIAKMRGYEDPRDIYKELDLRTKILDKMIELEIFDFYTTFDIFAKYNEYGLEGLPFQV